MRLHLVALASLAALVGCGSSGERSPDGADAGTAPQPPPAGPPLQLKKSGDIPGDAAFQAALADLASKKAIESSHIGAAGAPSGVYASFQVLAGLASREQFDALVMHESPVVRGYMARHALAKLDDASAVVPLLRDGTRVARLDGCAGGGSTIAELVTESLCDADVARPGRHRSLLAAAGDVTVPTSARAAVLSCLGKVNPTEAMVVAQELAKSSDQELVVAAIAVFGATERAADLVEPHLVHAAWQVRQAAARALTEARSPRSLAQLEPLLGDPAFQVRIAAFHAYARHPQRGEDPLRKGLADPAIKAHLAQELAALGADADIALLEGYVDANPKDRHLLTTLGAKPSDRVAAFMRRVLARFPVVLERAEGTPRSVAIQVLTRMRDTASLPEIRKSLESWDSAESLAAFAAVTELQDTGALADLERLATSKNDLQRQRATAALAKLRP